MSKIWFAGDVHGRLSHVLKALGRAEAYPAAIIFLGDLEPQRPLQHECALIEALGVACWHIHGNHDTDSEMTWQNMLERSDRNLDGRVVEIAGIRVAGLSGVFRAEVWYPQFGNEVPAYQDYDEYARAIRVQTGIRNRLSPKDLARLQAIPDNDPALLDASRQGKLLKHRSTIFPMTVERMATLRADILVSHEAPAGHPYGFRALDELARAMRVRTLVHGHHHREHRYEADATRGFEVVPVGYRSIRGEAGKVVLEARR